MATQSVDRIFYETDGDGSAVLMIHGLGGSSNFWTPLMPALTRRRTIRLDLPGSGRSAGVEGALSIDRFVEATLAVARHARVEQAHVVAHSLGTIVAAHLAVRAPDFVLGLTLYGPLPAPPDAGRSGLRARAEAARTGVAAMQEIADQVVNAATARETRERHPVAIAAAREMLMRQSPDGYARSCLALSEAQPAELSSLACPTSLITGDEDVIAPPQTVRAMGARITGAQVEVLPRCGHWTVFEKPEACADLLRRSLARRR
ncbi:MAG: alpha/beta fold hydrolase [Elsteraceae bacterium]